MARQELRWLLGNYHIMQALLGNLRVELQSAVLNSNITTEVIESLVFRRRPFDDIFATSIGGISRKTEDAALSYLKVVHEEQKEFIDGLVRDICTVSSVLEKIDAAMKALSPKETVIVKEHYFNSRPWAEIADALNVSIQQCKRLRDSAFNKLLLVLTVKPEEYNRVRVMLGNRTVS